MKLTEAINRIDKLKSNAYGRGEKIRWLSVLDGMVKTLILDTHEAGEKIPFWPYTEDTPDDTQLLIPDPYGEVYLWWLGAQIDYHNGEFTRYNNAIALFNTGFSAYAEHYHRQNRPLLRSKDFH